VRGVPVVVLDPPGDLPSHVHGEVGIQHAHRDVGGNGGQLICRASIYCLLDVNSHETDWLYLVTFRLRSVSIKANLFTNVNIKNALSSSALLPWSSG